MFKIAVLISGGGSNLQAVIDAVEARRLNAEIGLVIADRPAGGLDRAGRHGIPCCLLNRRELGTDLSREILNRIPDDTDLIVLAGYLSILTAEFTSRWEGRIINIHPALLPEFGGKGMYGMRVHEAVLKAGKTVSGCTVHYVDSGVDTGRIIGQSTVEVLPGDSPGDLQERVLEQEHRLLVDSIERIINTISDNRAV